MLSPLPSPAPPTGSAPNPASPQWHAADAARHAGATELAELLRASRARTLALADAYVAALGEGLAIPYSVQCNPPLWELGHLAWFQEFWLVRNPQRAHGVLADPLHPRTPSRVAQADAWYDSSAVAHALRWHLPLPDWHATRAYLAAGLQDTLDLLKTAGEDDAALYFYRLALFHEDMHGEAAVYMAQALGIETPQTLLRPLAQPQGSTNPNSSTNASASLRMDAAHWQLGRPPANEGSDGFAFDNELGQHTVAVPACALDVAPVTWAQYLAFVEAGGYAHSQWWTPEGWAWRQTQTQPWPRYLRPAASVGGWEQQVFGQWQALDLQASACHLTYFEAQAWCHWAGRTLPTEAQWEHAALTRPDMHWGDVWEWTASTFAAYPGFVAHPYRDYSAPWFGSRPVLRGGSSATVERMVHPRYRNYFTPERNDIGAGFRSCVLL